jgi:Protein of unknown function (DUF1761)
MESLNWAGILSASVIPLLVSVVYYHPKVLGTAAARVAGTEVAQGRRPVTYVYLLLLGVLLSVFIMPVVLHMAHVFSLVADAGPDSPAAADAAAFLGKYGGNFRTFKHGAFHGILSAVFGVWPVLAITAMMTERRSVRHIAIQLGYWAIVFALMGGTVCALA